MFPTLKSDFEHLLRLYGRLADVAGAESRLTCFSPEVSTWSVGLQIAHILASNRSIMDQIDGALQKDDQQRTGSPTLVGRLSLATGFIPRGRSKAPAAALPDQRLSQSAINQLVRSQTGEIRSMAASADRYRSRSARFAHQDFGPLTSRQWIRFMRVHTYHHLKIVRDIEDAASRQQSQ